MMNIQSNEILMVVDSVSNEGLNKEVIFNAVEIALASASQSIFMKMLS